MRSIEVSARTVEEAVGEGLLKLGCSISDCRVDIIQEGAKGFFGMFGSKPAMVRLTLLEEDANELQFDMLMLEQSDQQKRERRPETSEEPRAAKPHPTPEKRPERKPQPQKKSLQEIPIFEAAQPPQRSAHEDKPQNAKRAEPQRVRQRGPRQADPKAAPDAAQSGNVMERFKSAPLPDKQKPAAQRPQKKRPPRDEARDAAPMPVRVPMASPENIVTHDASTPEGVMQTFLLEVTKRMGVTVRVDVRRDDEGHMIATMYGDTLGILIGRRGETLDALQYLTSLQINKGQEEYVRCTLDTENYRAKREEALSRLAARMANRAVKTGRKVSLEPMNPYERRILHSSLQGNPHVTTHSEGDEPYRHVVVVPQK